MPQPPTYAYNIPAQRVFHAADPPDTDRDVIGWCADRDLYVTCWYNAAGGWSSMEEGTSPRILYWFEMPPAPPSVTS